MLRIIMSGFIEGKLKNESKLQEISPFLWYIHRILLLTRLRKAIDRSSFEPTDARTSFSIVIHLPAQGTEIQISKFIPP